MNKEQMIVAVRESDHVIREMVKIPLARVTFGRLKDLKFPTVKRINGWYGKLLLTKEWDTFRAIQLENPQDYWLRVRGEKDLPEVIAYDKAKRALQKRFKSTLPKEIARDIKSKDRKDSEASTNRPSNT
jgi:hypothetical protein